MPDAPNLNSATDAAAARYAPLSWMAVLSLTVAVVFVLVLAAFGWLAFSAGQPLLEGLLFAFPAVGILLAFIARRQIRNAEGARTGEGFANAGWWVCVIAGGCYMAYWLATEWSVRAEAERTMTAWAEKFRKGDPNNPHDPAVREAFLKVLDPASRQALEGNPQLLRAPEYGLKLAQFRDSPLLLVSARNPDAVLVPQGLKTWEINPEGRLDCEVAAVLRCAEGDFKVSVPLRGTTDPDTKKRAWQVFAGLRYLDPQDAARTRYGWLIEALDWQARLTVERTMYTLQHLPPGAESAPGGRAGAAATYSTAGGRAVVAAAYLDGRGSAFADAMLQAEPVRTAAAGGLGLFAAPPDPPDAFFTRPGGAPLTDAAYERTDRVRATGGLSALRGVWANAVAANLAPAWRAGNVPAEAMVQNTLIEVTPDRVLFKVPVEFRPSHPDFSAPGLFASGRLVLACDDPDVLKELAAAKAAGGDRTRERPDDLKNRPFPLRVVRLESDLTPVNTPKPPSAGGPPGQ